MELLLELNWLVIGQIILIDILLGGDNAIVIALACRNLPPHMRMKGIFWGTAGAIILRIVLIAFAVSMLQIPFLKFSGGVLLLWIGIKLLAAENDDHDGIAGGEKLWTAVKTVIVADLVMSIDNVIAVAAAAEHAGGEHQLMLVVFGILVSIPIIIGGSTVVLKLMIRFPIIISVGAAMLGYIAGSMIITDVAVGDWIAQTVPILQWKISLLGQALSAFGIVCAAGVVLVGHFLARRAHQRS